MVLTFSRVLVAFAFSLVLPTVGVLTHLVTIREHVFLCRLC